MNTRKHLILIMFSVMLMNYLNITPMYVSPSAKKLYRAKQSKNFDAYLANAQKNGDRIYFISNNLINSIKPESKKEDILKLFNSTQFIKKIENGFVCTLDKKIFDKIEGHRLLVTAQELKQNKTALLNEFGIPTNIKTPIETTKKIANRTNKQLLTYIYKTILELPHTKELQQIRQQQKDIAERRAAMDEQLSRSTIKATELMAQTQHLKPQLQLQQQAPIQQPMIMAEQEEEDIFREQEDLDYFMGEFEKTNTDKKTLMENIIITLSENKEYNDFFEWYNSAYNQTTKDAFNKLFFTSKWKKTLDTYKKQLLQKIGSKNLGSINRIRSIYHNDNTVSLFCLHKDNTMSVITVNQ